MIDASGTIAAAYRYNAWGKLYSQAGTMAIMNPLRYRGYYYDTETGFYYLQSRYYDPANCRFINADGIYDTEQGFLGHNMYAYCLNNPVAHWDSKGSFALLATLVILAAIIKTCDDMLAISSDGEDKVQASENRDGSVKITNSKNINTPWVRFGYSFYLNHFSEYSDNIKGSTCGVYFEWLVHDAAYDYAMVAEFFGADMEAVKGSSKDVDLSATIYDDTKHGSKGTAMKVGYSILSPATAIYDLVVYLFE